MEQTPILCHGSTCDRQSLSPDAEGILCGGLIVGLPRTAPRTAALSWHLRSQGEARWVAFGVIWYRHFVPWLHICCRVGKRQTLPFKTQGCQHLPFAVRKTWRKKEDVATHYVAFIKYLTKGLTLAVSIWFKNKDFCLFKVGSSAWQQSDRSSVHPWGVYLYMALYAALQENLWKKKSYLCRITANDLNRRYSFLI